MEANTQEFKRELKKYTGTKQVSAMPMTLGEFRTYSGRDPYSNSEDPGNSYMGYLVKYEDGYESWSPMEVFEKAYHCTETYIDRLKIEYNTETEKLNKLIAFTRSELFNKLPEYKKKKLYIQEKIMRDFVYILSERIYDELPDIGIGCCCDSIGPKPEE